MLRAFALYFQLANTAEQHHRIRRRRAYAVEDRAPRESLAEAFERLATVPEADLRERLADVSLQLVLTAHPTEATRRTLLRAHVRIADLLTRQDDPDLTAARARRARGRADRGDHDPLADRRGSCRPAACRRRDPAWALVLRGEPLRRRRAAAARIPAPRPRHPAAVLVRKLDRRRHRRQPRGERADDHGGARAGPRVGALAVPRGRARAVDRRLLERLARRDLRRARRLARPRCPGMPRIPRRRRADDVERALPAEALVHVVAPRERRLLRARRASRGHRDREAQSRGQPRRADRARGDRRARPARRALRLPPREARRAAARERGAESDGAHARGVRGRLGRPRTPRRPGARHRDRLGDRDARRRPRGTRPDRRGDRRRAAVRDDRRSRVGSRHRQRAPRRRRATARGWPSGATGSK